MHIEVSLSGMKRARERLVALKREPLDAKRCPPSVRKRARERLVIPEKKL
jgi:hypothetical protein